MSFKEQPYQRVLDLEWRIQAAYNKRSIWGYLLPAGSDTELEIQKAKTAAVIRECRQSRNKRFYSSEELFLAVTHEVEQRGFKPFPDLLSVESLDAFVKSLNTVPEEQIW